jgi:cellulose synthase/poly-beta-1,6-N-acetylglucosamine synthase-like glycosyltransferase
MSRLNNKTSAKIIPAVEDYKSMPPHSGRIEGGLRIRGKFHWISDSTGPPVSIVTIVFNGAKTLEQAILSVLNQTYKNIEYIIIDGGSTDGSIDILKKYDDKITYWMDRCLNRGNYRNN